LTMFRTFPERIIFCIDVDSEMDSTEISKAKRGNATRLDLVKLSIRYFIFMKQKMNAADQFAICTLTSGTVWFQDLTSDEDLLLRKITALQTQESFPSFDMGSLFEIINMKFPFLAQEQCTTDSTISSTNISNCSKPPFDCVYRVIFIYSRSNVIPHFEYDRAKKMRDNILRAPNFFFDLIYLHAKPSHDNRPQDVYDFLVSKGLEESAIDDESENSYMFENSLSQIKFLKNFTYLLAHPLQRPKQSSALRTFLSPQMNAILVNDT